jgi:ATP-dependent protease ClpP protease subunit
MIDKPNKDIVYVTPRAYEFTYYLSDCVQDSHEYHELLQALDSATENDLIRIVINNYGGEVGTCVQLCSHIRECKALVVGHISGNAFSAAGLIWLACHQQEISEHSMLMIHGAVGMMQGKYADMTAYITASNKRTELLYRDIFEHFLTEEEITSVFRGEEIWMLTDEMLERLEKRNTTFEKENQSLAKEYQQALQSLESETENLNYEDLIKLPTKKAILEALGITPVDK